MTYITISGHARAGKDTVAEILRSYYTRKGMSVLVVHYADLLKYICTTYAGWDGKKDEAGRDMLQYVGTEVYRAMDPDYWVNFVTTAVENLWSYGQWDYVIIPDCRFPNELLGVHIHVERPGFDNGLTAEQRRHASEQDLSDLSRKAVTMTLVNDSGLKELREAVEELADDIHRFCYDRTRIARAYETDFTQTREAKCEVKRSCGTCKHWSEPETSDACEDCEAPDYKHYEAEDDDEL